MRSGRKRRVCPFSIRTFVRGSAWNGFQGQIEKIYVAKFELVSRKERRYLHRIKSDNPFVLPRQIYAESEILHTPERFKFEERFREMFAGVTRIPTE